MLLCINYINHYFQSVVRVPPGGREEFGRGVGAARSLLLCLCTETGKNKYILIIIQVYAFFATKIIEGVPTQVSKFG